MEWYYIILLGVICWIFGMATGVNVGTTSTINRLYKPPHPHPTQPSPQDMAALLTMMGQRPPGAPQ